MCLLSHRPWAVAYWFQKLIYQHPESSPLRRGDTLIISIPRTINLNFCIAPDNDNIYNLNLINNINTEPSLV